jgi:membrane peptidoglycan carboxypeptidase
VPPDIQKPGDLSPRLNLQEEQSTTSQKQPMSTWMPSLAGYADPPQEAQRERVWKKRWRPQRYWRWLVLLALVVAIYYEARTSWLQSHVLSYVAQNATYTVRNGRPVEPMPALAAGPYDERLGYTYLKTALPRLERANYEITAQAEWSPMLRNLARVGIFPVYREKTQAGLQMTGHDDKPLFQSRYPERVYASFDEIPSLVVQSLLFIENREMLEPRTSYQNPAVEWDRLAKAMYDSTLAKLTSHQASGGSTLATQLEKVRHSPQGRTGSPVEKLRQMITASLRAYQDGQDTVDSRKRIVADYINSVPLSSAPTFGEVHGLGDALWVWFGSDFDSTNRALLADSVTSDQAIAYRQILSLLLAVNRPSYYLKDPQALAPRVDSYLKMLAAQKVISLELRDRALSARAELRKTPPTRKPVIYSERKSIDTIRGELVALLGLESTYQLDRLDLNVHTTLHGPATQAVSQTLQNLAKPGAAVGAGLAGRQLLPPGKEASVLYTLTLYEHTGSMNQLRLQVDNYNQPLNMNESTRLELGSTAKLRTLATYLEIVSELHEKLAAGEEVVPADPLSAWVVEAYKSERSLPGLLEAAMNRPFSGAPEIFFTGGGQHVFGNFSAGDNGRMLTLRQAFHNSVNLVFIRLMREVVWFEMAHRAGPSPLTDPSLRKEYLDRFIDLESKEFFTRYWKKYGNKTPDQNLETLFASGYWTPRRVAAAYRAVRPEATFDDFKPWFVKRYPWLEPELPGILFDKFEPSKFNWNDKAYLANIHPIEIWMVDYLRQNPGAKRDEVLKASKQVRTESYIWLLKSRNQARQNLRIKTLMEEEAFDEIHKRWKRQGYPFASLVPSLGTALGSSGDTPAALAELAGIVLNGGVRYPNARVTGLHFGEGTPMETLLRRKPADAERVFAPAVAAVLRQAMVGVVEQGTARPGFQALRTRNNEYLTIGGKTGTGDNRLEQYGPGGVLISSKVVNRTATFVFTIGERYFGTLVAYVPGAEAAHFDFTSALPVMIFRHLAPSLLPIVDPPLPGPAVKAIAHLPLVRGAIQVGR